jgi:hypothetical protein
MKRGRKTDKENLKPEVKVLRSQKLTYIIDVLRGKILFTLSLIQVSSSLYGLHILTNLTYTHTHTYIHNIHTYIHTYIHT